MNKVIVLGLLLLVISGCTNKDLYDSFQPDRSNCRKLPLQQREECNKGVDEQLPYDEYKKQRESL